jgi:SAM-dependent methyltransferase
MATARTQDAQPLTPKPHPTADDLERLLTELYRKQLALDPGNRFLAEHGRPSVIANQVRTFHWYRPYLPATGTVLDWGCNHAPDSCLLRAWFGDRLRLHSCDFVAAVAHPVFHEFACSAHTQLEHPVQLPYEPEMFDAVIGSGVLEHAAMDYESLKELRRVLKPEGLLIISYLPNWLSWQEWLRRVVRRRDFHRRLYGLGEAKQLLKRSGFYPVAADYHTYIWERLLRAVGLGRWERGLSAVLSRLLPIQVFGSTLCLIARKVLVM